MPAKSANPLHDDEELRVADETTPLLTAPESAEVASTQNGSTPDHQANGHPTHKPLSSNEHENAEENEEDNTPLPYTQILLLCYAALAEPVAYFAIFPFVNEMIHLKGHIAEENVGFWSGMIESLFSIVQMILMVFYGRAADRLGRKPVLVFSLTGVAFATALFGMGQNLWQMILARALAGTFAGSVVTMRTMVSENTTKKTQARAFSWYMCSRNFGIFVGPLIGGAFANPADQFPGAFKGVPFWEKYPYALATFVAGGMVLSAAIVTLLFVNETLKRKTDTHTKSEPEMTTLEVIRSPGVIFVLYIMAHTSVLGLSYTAVIPVFLYTSVKNGGFGFSDQWIAIFMAIGGGSQAIWMLLAFPLLQKRLGTGTVLRWCAAGWLLFLGAYPIGNELLRNGMDRLFWILIPILLVIGSGVAMGYACVQLQINDVSPSSRGFATLNALALSISSGVRAFAPAAFTSIYATGVRLGILHGQLIFIFFFLLAGALLVSTQFIPANAEGKPEKSSDAVRNEHNE